MEKEEKIYIKTPKDTNYSFSRYFDRVQTDRQTDKLLIPDLTVSGDLKGQVKSKRLKFVLNAYLSLPRLQ